MPDSNQAPDPTLPEPVTAYLRDQARRAQPQRLAVIGRAPELMKALTAALPNTQIEQPGVADLRAASSKHQARYDLAIVADTLEHLTASDGRTLLGRLRDVAARQSLVVVGPDTEAVTAWAIADFIGLGFRRSPDSRRLAPGWQIYRYDIHDYKTTPDWLNARYWANPERWDSERW